MALKDFWGRLAGRETPAPAPAPPPPLPALEPAAPDADLLILPPEVEAELLARLGDPVPEPAPVQEPPLPIPIPPEDDPAVEPPPDSPTLPPAEEPGDRPAPIVEPSAGLRPGGDWNRLAGQSATHPPRPAEPSYGSAAGAPVAWLPGGRLPVVRLPGGGLTIPASPDPIPAPVVTTLPDLDLSPPPGARPAGPTPDSPPPTVDPRLPWRPVGEPPGATASPVAAAIPAPAPTGAGVGFFGRLKAGLQRSTQRLTENLTGLFTKRPLDEAALEELEDTLVAADLGVAAAARIVASFRRTRFGREVSDEEVKQALAEEIAAILAPVAQPLLPRSDAGPCVVLLVGVNGTGKTTTIAKLAEQWRGEGQRVMLAAGDTFRAAAVEQLQVWGERTGCPVVVPAKPGADAAGLAHDALDRAVAEGMDVLLVDTAGRLHNKAGLMEELRKIIRVLRRRDPAVPHAVVLVLDATTGQNAIQQVKVFREMVAITGLVVTKLDGSAKGGVVVALAQEFGLPVHAVGVGEKAADLRPFDPRDFARSLVGLG